MSFDSATPSASLPGPRPTSPFPRDPTGWFQVAWSDELQPGDVKQLGCFGKPLVLFRTESGRPSVLDARCPHMSAHLGRGGKVRGESIVCPSHGWQFGADGACTAVPYLNHIPPNSSVRRWPLWEGGGLIMLWHDIDKRPPAWDLQPLSEHFGDDWSMPVRREWKLRSGHHEIAEHLIPTARVGQGGLHEAPDASAPTILFDAHRIRITAAASRTPLAAVAEGPVDCVAMGLGCVAMRITRPMEALIIGCVTPIDQEHVQLRLGFKFRTPRSADGLDATAEALVSEASRWIEASRSAWEDPANRLPGGPSDGAAPLDAFRRWAGQFRSVG